MDYGVVAQSNVDTRPISVGVGTGGLGYSTELDESKLPVGADVRVIAVDGVEPIGEAVSGAIESALLDGGCDTKRVRCPDRSPQ